MSDDVEDFQELMKRVKEGSEEAARELVERYGNGLRHAIRRALDAKLRSKFDSLDFAQLVWYSFFRHGENASRFSRPEELAAFLIKMATNKVGLEVRRRLTTQKYNINREISLEQSMDEAMNIPDGQPVAVELLIERERREHVLSGHGEQCQEIIQLRLQGLTNRRIANRLGVAEITVRRFLKKILPEAWE